MVPANEQRQLDLWTEGKMSETVMQGVFGEHWSNWNLYRDIFLFARDNRIPMVALDVLDSFRPET
jgi:hypothetical protein